LLCSYASSQFRQHPYPPTPPPPSPSSFLFCFHLYVATEQPESSRKENINVASRPFALRPSLRAKNKVQITLYTMYVIIHLIRLGYSRSHVHLSKHAPHTIGYNNICEPNIRCLNSINAHFSGLCSCSDSLLSPLDPPAPESILRRSISWHEYSQLTASLVRGRRRQRQRREKETDGCGAHRETGIHSGNTFTKQNRPALHFEARQCSASFAVDKLDSRRLD